MLTEVHVNAREWLASQRYARDIMSDVAAKRNAPGRPHLQGASAARECSGSAMELGTGTGWMQGLATFMPARGTRPALGRRHIRGTDPAADERPFARDLWLHDGVSSWATLTTLRHGPRRPAEAAA